MPVIVGAPRSGTTLLRLMLDSHPDMAIPPETGFLTLGSELKGSGEALRDAFFRAVVTYPRAMPCWPDFEIPDQTFHSALSQINPFTISDGFRTFYRLYAARFDKPRWGDKTPLYCLALNAIRDVLPEARFVHLIRDGRDVALSSRAMWFSPGWRIEAQARFWKKCVATTRQAGLGREDYIEVRYEDLILRPQETLDRICARLDLSYDEAVLDYHRRAPARLAEHKGRTRSDGTVLITQEQRRLQQARTTSRLDPACVFGWKRSMTADERKRFGRVAGTLLQELGYEP